MPEKGTRTHRQTRVGFDTTNWTMVMAATNPNLPGTREALEQLCRQYWRSIYAFIRQQRFSPEDAQDLTQGFLLHLLQGNRLRQVHPAKGKLRSFLLAALQNYLQNQRDWARAKKRGGGQIPVPIDFVEPAAYGDPVSVFDRQWASSIFTRVLKQLREDCVRGGKEQWFDALQPFLTAEAERGDHGQIAGQLRMPETSVRSAVSRLRAQFRDLLRVEVAKTVEQPSQIDEEVRYLLSLV